MSSRKLQPGTIQRTPLPPTSLRSATSLKEGGKGLPGELVFGDFLPSPLGRVAERSEVGRGSLTYCFLALFRKMTPKNLFRQPFGLPPSPKGKARGCPDKLLFVGFYTHDDLAVGEAFMPPVPRYVFAERFKKSGHLTAGSQEWLPYCRIEAF